MSQRPDVVFVERFFYPDGWGAAQIPRDIVEELATSGLKVAAVCGREQYVPEIAGQSQDPRNFGVSIWYVPRFGFGKSRSKSISSQLWFCSIASIKMILRGRPRLFMVQTNPPLVVVAVAFVAWLLRRPLIVVAQDLYPEVMVAHGMLRDKSIVGRVLVEIFRKAYQSAALVVSLGPGMTARLLQKGVAANRIREISNWATGEPTTVRGSGNQVIDEWGLMGKFVVLYSGNLGIAHDADTMVQAVAIASKRVPRLRLVIVGVGARIERTKRLVEELGLSEFVIFKSSVPLELLPHTLGAADLALVTLLPGFEGLVVPSKLFGHMARGIPTMYIGPSNADVADVLAKSSGGIMVANGDASAAASSLIKLAGDQHALEQMGSAAASYYDLHLSRRAGLSEYRKIVQSVLQT